MAKVEKRQQQEEDAAKKLKAAEAEYRAKIDVANQKQLKIKDETSNTAKELQVRNIKINFKNELKKGITHPHWRDRAANGQPLFLTPTYGTDPAHLITPITPRIGQGLYGN